MPGGDSLLANEEAECERIEKVSNLVSLFDPSCCIKSATGVDCSAVE